MRRDYEIFVDVVFSKLDNIYRGYNNYICFQTYGFSDEQVRKLWKKMRKEYDLPRAKKIEQACINF